MYVDLALARAFGREGVSQVFAVMGDANLRWLSRIAVDVGIPVLHARHEGAAVAMADGYARSLQRPGVGVASVTCGPGLTNALTSLGAAVQNQAPVVVVSGEVPAQVGFHPQRVDQRVLVEAVGARYLHPRSPEETVAAGVEAVRLAARERCPVVLAPAFDVYAAAVAVPGPSTPFPAPEARYVDPAPDAVDRLVARCLRADKVVLLCGRGTIAAGARELVLELADRLDARVATTLEAAGLFRGHSRDLGVVGGVAEYATRTELTAADLVVLLGARGGWFTTDGGRLVEESKAVRVDLVPRVVLEGRPVEADTVVGDVGAVLRAVLASVPAEPRRGGGAASPTGPVVPPASATVQAGGAGGLHPRTVTETLAAHLPLDIQVVAGLGHHTFFTLHDLACQDPGRFVHTYGFAAIGQGLATAIGAAVARPDTATVLVDGDGGLAMASHELWSLARLDRRVLVIVMNDAGYQVEAIKLRREGLPDGEAHHEPTDFARLAAGHGIAASTVTCVDELVAQVEAFLDGSTSRLLDVAVDRSVVSDQYAPRSERQVRVHRPDEVA